MFQASACAIIKELNFIFFSMSFDARLVRRRPAAPAHTPDQHKSIPEPHHAPPGSDEEHPNDPAQLPLAWQAPEFSYVDVSTKFYTLASLVLLSIITYAVVSNSPIMAITFVLIGVVGYLYLEQEPRVIDCAITRDGVVMEKELYEFKNIKSFAIAQETYGYFIVLETTGKLLGSVSVPLGNVSPAQIRAALAPRLQEKRYEPTLIDIFERLLHI
jgi:hypothetical protein